MWTYWMIFAYGFLVFAAFLAGRSADAARERTLRKRTAEEVRRLAEERKLLAVERERYRAEVLDRRRTRSGRNGDDDQPPGGAPPMAA
jgi:hypothetical protein